MKNETRELATNVTTAYVFLKAASIEDVGDNHICNS